MPETYLDSILPHCKDCYVSVHIETTDSFFWIADKIRRAGAKPAVALNSSTPASAIEEILPVIDLVTILTFDAGRSLNVPGVKEHVCNKVEEIKNMCMAAERSDIIIECDGGITFDDTKMFRSYGANAFVLGRDSVYAKTEPLSEKIKELRAFINNL